MIKTTLTGYIGITSNGGLVRGHYGLDHWLEVFETTPNNAMTYIYDTPAPIKSMIKKVTRSLENDVKRLLPQHKHVPIAQLEDLKTVKIKRIKITIEEEV